MSRLRAHFTLAMVLLLVLAAGLPAQAQTKLPDSTLYTQYYTNTSSQLHWITCGSLPQSEGCYGSGELGPFTNACAVVQSVPAPINSFTVLRYIYVLDTGSSSNGVTLTAYKRTDTVSQSNDTIVVTTVASVPLTSLAGGSGVTCMMVQNPTNVYAGTNQSSSAVSINKSNYSVSQVGVVFGTVSSITADSYGYVTINQDDNGSYGNTVYGPNGQLQSDGGGGYFMINPIDALNPSNYPFTLGAMPQVGYWPKSGVSADK